MAFKSLLLSIAFFMIVNPSPLGQEIEDPKPTKPQQNIEDLERKAREQRNNIVRNPALADPELLVAAYKDSFRFWPKQEPGKEAVSQVLKGGKNVIKVLLPLLDERDYRKKPAVAFMLGKLGCKEALDKIIYLLRDPHILGDKRTRASARHILLAVEMLDSDGAKALAIDLLKSKTSALRHAAYSLLNQNCGPKEIKALFAYLKAPEKDLRRKAFTLISNTPSEELDTAALGMVGDPYPQLARMVSLYLVERNSPQVLEGLKKLLTFERERTFAYALSTLTLIENNYNTKILDPVCKEKLVKLLECREPLIQVSAACALGNLCHDTGDDADRNLVRSRVVPAIMYVFLPNCFFSDYNFMLDLAAESMRKMTGESFDRDLTFWREWWKSPQGMGFVGHQFLLAVDSTQYGDVTIRYKNRDKNILLVGQNLIIGFTNEESMLPIILNPTDMGAVIELFYVNEFFSRKSEHLSKEHENTLETLLEVKVGDCARRITRKGDQDANFDAMTNCLLTAYEDNHWQLLFPGGERLSWWQSRYDWWKERIDKPESTERFITEFVSSFEILSDEVILYSLEWLKRRPHLNQCITKKTVISLLDQLKGRYRVDPVVRGMVRMIASSGHHAYFEALLTFLYGNYDEAAYPLLAETLIQLDCIDQAFSDQRDFVREVAAIAAPDSKRYVLPQVMNLLEDDAPDVQTQALCSLIAMAPDKSVDHVMVAANTERKKLKLAVLKAVNKKTHAWSLDLYETVLKADDSDCWMPALDGLAKHRSKRAVAIATEFIEKKAIEANSINLGVDALQRIGGRGAREVLNRIYKTQTDKELKRRIAFGLAKLGDVRAIPYLEDCLMEGDLRKRALDSISNLLVVDYGKEIWKYRELRDKFPDQDQAFFLKRALGILDRNTQGVPCYEGVPVQDLVSAVKNGPWPIRMAALRILEEHSKVSFGEVTRESDSHKVKKIAKAWEGWLQKQA